MGLKFEELSSCDIVFVCVPTPSDKDGRCYSNIVTSVVTDLQKLSHDLNIVIRSTVIAGISNKLGVFFMPEFLTENNWREDFKNNKQWIVGLNESKNIILKEKIQKVFSNARESGKIISDECIFVKSDQAEMVKYFKNTFLALKVSFCNEIYDYCQEKKINYDIVQKIVSLDERIGASHMLVPGHDGRRGYGGTCFPKDTKGLWYDFKDNKIPSYILDATLRRNTEKDRPEQDWKKDVGRAVV